MKKKSKLPSCINEEQFTSSEIAILCDLIQIFVTKLSLNGNINEKALKMYSYQGLFELGIHSPDAWVSKLIKHDQSTVAQNIIVAHGYTKARF